MMLCLYYYYADIYGIQNMIAILEFELVLEQV